MITINENYKRKWVCVIKKTIFKKYWEILKRNKNDKTHTEEDMAIYYSLFKDVEDQIFIEAVKEVLLNVPYFPRVDELNECIQHTQQKDKTEKWKEIKVELLTKEDKEWCKNFYKKYCDSEEEYHERLVKNNLEVVDVKS